MNETKYIELRKYREFGEMITVLIEFCKQNFKPLFGLYVRYGLSFIVIGFVLGLMIGMSGNAYDAEFLFAIGGVGNLVFYFFLILAMLAMTSAIFGYVQGYVESGPESAEASVGRNFWSNMASVLKVYLSFFFIFAVAVGFLSFLAADISLWLSMFFIPAFFAMIYYWIKLILAPYVCTQEGFNVTGSFGESYQLTDDKWWWTFGLYFVMTLIGSVLTYILMIPIMLLLFIPQFVGGAEFDESSFGNTMLITNFVTYAGYMIYAIVLVLLMPFMYYSLADLKYGTSIEKRMDEGDDEVDSIFENEGEV